MKNFNKYQHLERFGTDEVLNIEVGVCHIFPKIDGTNASIWWNDGLQAGSRNRHLSLDNDNAGFLSWAIEQENLKLMCATCPDLTFYGEWLVPHSLKTYRSAAWKKFYIFDIVCHDKDGNPSYIHYDDYKGMLDHYQVDYIPPLATVNNCNYDKLIQLLEFNNFLIEDGKGAGEGIVIKNYDYKNKYGRTTWAKIVTSEFREKHTKEMGASYVDMKPPVEQSIVDEFVTQALVDKVYAKISQENGFTSRQIPQLLSTVFYDLVREESWNFIKKHKNPTINFSILQHIAYRKVKELLPNLF